MMLTQKEELAKRGVDHDLYDILIQAPDPRLGVDDETTGIMVSEKATGNYRKKTIPQSRRELAEPSNTTYIDTIVELVHELEGK